MTAMNTAAISEARRTRPCQAEVPAVELAGDDGADAERPQGPQAGVSPQPPFFEVVRADLAVGDRADLALLRHGSLPSSRLSGRPQSCTPTLLTVQVKPRGVRQEGCCHTAQARAGYLV